VRCRRDQIGQHAWRLVRAAAGAQHVRQPGEGGGSGERHARSDRAVRGRVRGVDIAPNLRTPLICARTQLEGGRDEARTCAEFQAMADRGVGSFDEVLAIGAPCFGSARSNTGAVGGLRPVDLSGVPKTRERQHAWHASGVGRSETTHGDAGRSGRGLGCLGASWYTARVGPLSELVDERDSE
jgi:hypothetical protein